ncbi:MAG: DUF72 domain-containing protein [Williamsia sp.]|nr:DUF72 domain-containing protein [Williamsia sp.]
MHFGRVLPHEIDRINFTLPPDPPLTLHTLQTAGKAQQPGIYLGCPVWGSKPWIGKMYPAKTKDAEYLDHYVQHFNTIELNATHYKIYDAATIDKWAAKARDRVFLFCPKVPQAISHYSNLASRQASDLTDEFLQSILHFKQHLGPVFLQLSENFSPMQMGTLLTYLEAWPRDMPLFVEVRHAQWFAEKRTREAYFQALKRLNLGAVLTDTSGRRDALHMELTIPQAFIRFVCNRDHPSNYTRIDAWVERIHQWLDTGLQTLYFFVHYPDDVQSPELADYFAQQLNERCHTHLTRPLFISGEQAIQQSLF